jgi:hypothetical protein
MVLDDSKLEELRQWGQALRAGASAESAAAGRAILMLIEELERLRLKLRLAGDQPERSDQAADSKVEEASEPVSSALHGRLRRALDRDADQSLEACPEPVEETGAGVEPESDTASARSWIETLRRQR